MKSFFIQVIIRTRILLLAFGISVVATINAFLQDNVFLGCALFALSWVMFLVNAIANMWQRGCMKSDYVPKDLSLTKVQMSTGGLYGHTK